MANRPLKIAITTGDLDGIGAEVSCKALKKIGPQKGVQFFLWRSKKCSKALINSIDRSFHRQVVSSWPEALNQNPSSSKVLIDIASSLNPVEWVKSSADACMYGHLDAIATAPLSKSLINETGNKEIGHTEILAKISKSDLFMGFIGKYFNVILVTAHLPLVKVSEQLTEHKIIAAISAGLELRGQLSSANQVKPLGVLGLNPHSGEDGLMGNEERVIRSALKQFPSHDVDGPLVPDAAFFEKNWKRYSAFVCMYHDQGLVPFKMVHGQDSGLQISLGLPFVRTSVDHGTAKDIFGKNKANPNSMVEAISWAIKLSKKRRGEHK